MKKYKLKKGGIKGDGETAVLANNYYKISVQNDNNRNEISSEYETPIQNLSQYIINTNIDKKIFTELINKSIQNHNIINVSPNENKRFLISDIIIINDYINDYINNNSNIDKEFTKLDNTNNGIIYIPQPASNPLRGGKFIPLNNNHKLNDFFRENYDYINDYNIKISEIDDLLPKYIASLQGKSQTENDFMNKFFLYNLNYHNIDNFFISIFTEATADVKSIPDIMDENLIGNIMRNYKIGGEILTIHFDKDKKYNISDLKQAPLLVNDEEYKLDFTHSTYNEDIVTAYEKNYIENFDKLQEFIEIQNQYITNLTLTEKIIINDYTKYSCFRFYKAYTNAFTMDNLYYARNVNGLWIKDKYFDEKDNDKFCFGDSLYKQILEVIGIDKFKEILNQTDETYRNIDEYWNWVVESGNDRINPESISPFAEKLTDTTWHFVMIKFIADINVIVKKAPTVDHPIYCYRGVSGDYINIAREDTTLETYDLFPATMEIKKGTYTSVRIGSFSINFNSSKKYAKDGNMYRVVIAPNVPVLYAMSLSYASHEFEIIHAGYAEFINKGPYEDAYNNKDNKWGILSNENEKFKNVDIYFNGYNNSFDPHNNINEIEESIGIYREKQLNINSMDILTDIITPLISAVLKAKNKLSERDKTIKTIKNQIITEEMLIEIKKNEQVQNSDEDMIIRINNQRKIEREEQRKRQIEQERKEQERLEKRKEDIKNDENLLRQLDLRVNNLFRFGGGNNKKYINYKFKDTVYKRKVYFDGKKKYVIINKEKHYIKTSKKMKE
jgi:hypothetical protein